MSRWKRELSRAQGRGSLPHPRSKVGSPGINRIDYDVDQKFIDRLHKQPGMTPRVMLHLFCAHYADFISSSSAESAREARLRRSDFVEFRCVKLDLRGRAILGEVTYPDRGHFFVKEPLHSLMEFEKLKVNSSLKKRKDAASKTRLGYFCRLLNRAFNHKIDAKACFTLEYENVFDNKNSLESHRPHILYVFLGLVTRPLGFLALLRRELVRHILRGLLARLGALHAGLWEALLARFEAWTRFFERNAEMDSLFKTRHVDLGKARRIVIGHLQNFLAKWQSQLLSNPLNGRFEGHFGALRAALEDFAAEGEAPAKAAKFAAAPGEAPLPAPRFKDAKSACKKARAFPRRVCFLSFRDSFVYIKKLFLRDSGTQADDVQLDSLKLDLLCKMTFTPLEFPVRGNNCLHLACFSLRSFVKSSARQEYKKTYCPFCKEPIQVPLARGRGLPGRGASLGTRFQSALAFLQFFPAAPCVSRLRGSQALPLCTGP